MGQTLFLIAGLFVALCIVPIAVTRSIHPELPHMGHFQIRRLIRRAPVGVMGCFAAGLINSSVYSMAPVFGHLIHLDVLVFLAMTMALFCPVVILASRGDFRLLVLAMAGFGGLVFSIYPVAVARTYDLFGSEEIVKVSSALLLSYGVGAAAGPALSSGVMEVSGNPYGFFLYIAAISGLFAAVTFFLRKTERIEVVPVEEQVDFMILRNTSPVAIHLDPRTEPVDGDTGEPLSGEGSDSPEENHAQAQSAV